MATETVLPDLLTSSLEPTGPWSLEQVTVPFHPQLYWAIYCSLTNNFYGNQLEPRGTKRHDIPVDSLFAGDQGRVTAILLCRELNQKDASLSKVKSKHLSPKKP